MTEHSGPPPRRRWLRRLLRGPRFLLSPPRPRVGKTWGRWPTIPPPTVPPRAPVRFHCPQCKVPLDHAARRCPNCGAPVVGDAPPARPDNGDRGTGAR